MQYVLNDVMDGSFVCTKMSLEVTERQIDMYIIDSFNVWKVYKLNISDLL